MTLQRRASRRLAARVCVVLSGISLLLSGWACGAGEADKPPASPTGGPTAAEPLRTAPGLASLLRDLTPQDPFDVERVFPEVAFEEALYAIQRDVSGPLYVLEQKGYLWGVVQPQGLAQKTLILDISAHTYFDEGTEAGALGVAFHPKKAELFVFYVSEQGGDLYDRVSRFALRDDLAVLESEEVLIEQRHDWHRDRRFGEHFGGGLSFGPDGYLYIGVGDEGWVPERVNSQELKRDLFSGVLRIDVDCVTDESHAPPRQPGSGETDGYCIPNDNPFVGEPGVLEEFYLVGLRNPYRFSFDRETTQLWLADVGSDQAEEVNLGVPGGNYEWSYREGVEVYRNSYLGGEKPTPFFGAAQQPLFAYPHGSGNGCIIGGYVYRGGQYPELVGSYVFGDLNSGRVWALLAGPDQQVLKVTQLAQVPPHTLLSFGEMADGEILLVGRPPLGVSKLVRRPRVGPPLSATGLFLDVPNLVPAPGVIPYEMNLPAYANGARTRYWAAIPGDGLETGAAASRNRVLFRREGPWGFPSGSVFVQHFDLPVDDSDPTAVRPIETRLLALGEGGGARGASYRWNSEGSEAFRVDSTVTTEIEFRENGRRVTRPWEFQASADCLTCHHLGLGHVIGVNTRQLDRPIANEPGLSDRSQLQSWNQAGMFTLSGVSFLPLRADSLKFLEPLATDETGGTIEQRARAYLDANCAYCHGPAGGLIDLRREAPLAPLLERVPRHAFGLADGARLIVPGAPERSLLYLRLASNEPHLKMPPVGRVGVDMSGAELIAEWIGEMPRGP